MNHGLGIYISLHKCKKLYCAFLHNKSNQSTECKYRAYAKSLQHLKRQAKLNYYGRNCKTYKHNTKKLWGIINEISANHNDKSSLVDCLRINDVLEYNAKKITNKFGEYISNVGKEFAKKVAQPKNNALHYCQMIPRNEKSLFMLPCTGPEITKLIQQLPMKTSNGHDNISNVLLKAIGMHILAPLTKIFNESLCTGIFPDIIKLADMVTLYLLSTAK